MNTRKKQREPALQRLVRKLRAGDLQLLSGVAAIFTALLSLGWYLMQSARDIVNAGGETPSIVINGNANIGTNSSSGIDAGSDINNNDGFASERPMLPAPSASAEVVITAHSRKILAPVWNAWFEPTHHRKPNFAPAEALEVNSPYSLFVHLSGIMLKNASVSREAGTTLRDYLQSIEGDSTELQILLLPDEKFFALSSHQPAVVTVPVDLAKLRRMSSQEEWDAVDHAADPLWDLGAASFLVNTKRHSGGGSLGVSIWADGSPIGEFIINACVGLPVDDCDSQIAAQSLEGMDSIRLSQQVTDGSRPDGALHFVALTDASVVGVFRCNSCGWQEDEFLSWPLNRDVGQLVDYLGDAIQPAFERAVTYDKPRSFDNAGADLYRTFFNSHDARSDRARKAFEAFVADHVLHPRPAPAPSIFVRLVSDLGAPPFYGVPLALMNIRKSTEPATFIGEHFRIETPLDIQDYAKPAACIDNWVVLAPPAQNEDAALVSVRRPIETWLEELRAAGGKNAVYEDIDQFRAWLEVESPDTGAATAPQVGTAIAIMGHHAQGSMYFDELRKVPNITASTITRKFPPPTVAIINACGSASPGAVDFVTELNQLGVATIIATATTVDGKMAGAFMYEVIKTIDAHRAQKDYPIGAAVFDASRVLRKEFGPKILIYSVLGNSGIALCASGASPAGHVVPAKLSQNGRP